MAGNGLEVRVPFLDHAYVDYVLRLDPAVWRSYSVPYVMEKKLLRDAFVGYLPDEILFRSKEAFSDAVSSQGVNWYKSIQHAAEMLISDEVLHNAHNVYTFNTPKTKEAYYFRQLFDLFYPHHDHVIQHYWLPKFQKEEVNDPSATILKCYANETVSA